MATALMSVPERLNTPATCRAYISSIRQDFWPVHFNVSTPGVPFCTCSIDLLICSLRSSYALIIQNLWSNGVQNLESNITSLPVSLLLSERKYFESRYS